MLRKLKARSIFVGRQPVNSITAARRIFSNGSLPREGLLLHFLECPHFLLRHVMLNVTRQPDGLMTLSTDVGWPHLQHFFISSIRLSWYTMYFGSSYQLVPLQDKVTSNYGHNHLATPPHKHTQTPVTILKPRHTLYPESINQQKNSPFSLP